MSLYGSPWVFCEKSFLARMQFRAKCLAVGAWRHQIMFTDSVAQGDDKKGHEPTGLCSLDEGG
jgi:hypothetical protein